MENIVAIYINFVFWKKMIIDIKKALRYKEIEIK